MVIIKAVYVNFLVGKRLPPLSGEPQFRNPSMMSGPGDGPGMRGSDTIISVPSDGAEMRPSDATKAGPGIISVPGDSVNLSGTPGLREKSNMSRGLGNLKRKYTLVFGLMQIIAKAAHFLLAE